jgi:hypothetical protein
MLQTAYSRFEGFEFLSSAAPYSPLTRSSRLGCHPNGPASGDGAGLTQADERPK